MSKQIAIVGAGISGLVCAHLLHADTTSPCSRRTTTPAATRTPSGLTLADGTHHVDTGFIVLNDRTYPGFERLLERLGVATQPSEMSFSVSDGGDFEYNGASRTGCSRAARISRGPPFTG